MVTAPLDRYVNASPSRVVPGPVPRALLYDEFVRQHRNTVASHEAASRRQFLRFYNKSIAPHLHTEEAALQILSAKVFNLYLAESYPVELHICRDLQGNPVDRYDRSYLLSAPFIDRRGLVMYEMQPTDPEKDVVFIFPGTAGFSRRDVLSAQNLPTGRLADMDRTGVGKQIFAQNRDVITRRVREVIDRGQDVTLVGFSLGGAYAARTLASLPPGYQRRCQLRSFFAPGLDEATACAIVPDFDNIVSVYHVYDIVCAAGDRHLPGKSVRITDMVMCGRTKLTPHSIPQLAVRELRGEPLGCTVSRTPRAGNVVVESMRKTLSRFVESWVAP